MSLQPTNFVIVGAPIDPAFHGTPQQYFEHILERMKIFAPFGISTFVTGAQMPSSNQGPWLKDGTEWWVWSDEAKTYVPLVISSSLEAQLSIGPTQPTEDTVLFWAQTTTLGGPVINLWIKSGGVWRPLLALSGPTANRPTSPTDLQQYWDTDIDVLIHWERAAWRTVSGSPGDVKFVSHPTYAEAIRHNPGWIEIGGSSIGVDARGRALVPAHSDPGGAPDKVFPAEAGITQRAVGDTFGEEEHTLTVAETPEHDHVLFNLQTVGAGAAVAAGEAAVTSRSAVQNADYTIRGVNYAANPPDVGLSGPVGGGDAHNNLAPRIALWCLVKQ